MIPLVKSTDPILRQVAERVQMPLSTTLRRAVQTWSTVATELMGWAIAAPQLGISLRIFALAHGVFPALPRVYINPVWTCRGAAMIDGEEGCLSLPGVVRRVPRSAEGVLWGVDIDNRALEIPAKGHLARVFQHELDHLDGKLIDGYPTWDNSTSATGASVPDGPQG